MAGLTAEELAALKASHETQESICAWAVATFGDHGSDLRVAARANEEMAELLRKVTVEKPDLDAVAEEAADVLIVLCRLGKRRGWPVGFDMRGGGVVANGPLYWALNASFKLNRVMCDIDRQAYGLDQFDGLIRDLKLVIWSCGRNVQDVVDHKMAVNRHREWKPDGTGHGYHVRAGSAAESRAAKPEQPAVRDGRDVLHRLEVLCRKEEMDGWHVRANIVWSAIEEIERLRTLESGVTAAARGLCRVVPHFWSNATTSVFGVVVNEKWCADLLRLVAGPPKSGQPPVDVAELVKRLGESPAGVTVHHRSFTPQEIAALDAPVPDDIASTVEAFIGGRMSVPPGPIPRNTVTSDGDAGDECRCPECRNEPVAAELPHPRQERYRAISDMVNG